MKMLAPRPLTLALTLALIVGAIAFIELRLGTADPNAERAEAEAPSPSAQPAGETTPAPRDAPKDVPESPPQAERNGPERAASGGPPDEKAAGDAAARISRKEAEYRRAEEIVAPSGFINADAVSVAEARGEKVVLVEFWTYTCYNCQNVQPYVNSWHEEYADDGLLVIGVHKPEFEFEKDRAGVEEAVRQAGIEYPVVLDNASATWDAYDNRYWPAWYLIDADGFVRYQHFGEGAYDETEGKIRELLEEKDRS